MIVKQLKKFLILSVLIGMTSCVSKQKMAYFNDQEGIRIADSIQNYEPKIQYGDLLNITVTAMEEEAAIPFNKKVPTISQNLRGGSQSPSQSPSALGYLVNANGEINFPVLGYLKVKGLTTIELTNFISEKLVDYITNPVISIRFENFKVTLLGEVANPGPIIIPNERVSILDAIGLAGDLTIQGNRKKVTLIREQDGKRLFIPIDLTNKKVFNSPYFYLAQNDVVYVEPNKAKMNSSVVGPSISLLFGSVGVLLSIITLIIR